MTAVDETRINALAALIAGILINQPGLSARDLARLLQTTKPTVNPILYGHRDLFFKVGDSPPRWFISLTSPSTLTFGGLAQSGTSRPLYAWQREALLAWQANGRRGIVQAVTAAGKTELALAAIEAHLDRRGKVAVIVPGVDLARQWEARIGDRFPSARIGLMGDGDKATLDVADIVVAVVHSASHEYLGLNGDRGLLIADEVHRYATESFVAALEDDFEARLGLTATLERDDGAHMTLLLPYFTSVVFTLGYRRALADGVIAPYKVALVGVDLTRDEKEEYDRLSQAMTGMSVTLIRDHGVRGQPFRDFMADVTWLNQQDDRRASIAASRWLKACRDRRTLLAQASMKTTALDALTPSLRSAERSLVFTETVASSDVVASHLRYHGLSVQAIHSHLARPERERILGDFAAGRLHSVVAPRLLDEGIDVPDADLAVVLAASRSRRQMIQRMGRVLRRKSDHRRARFVIVYVLGSSDDPDDVYYEGQHDELLDAADEEDWFDPSEIGPLTDFLAPD